MLFAIAPTARQCTMRPHIQPSSAMQPRTFESRPMRGPNPWAHGIFRTICVVQLGLVVPCLVQAALLVSSGHHQYRDSHIALLVVMCVAFALDLLLLVQNMRVYLAWRRQQGANNPSAPGLDPEEAGGTQLTHTHNGTLAASGNQGAILWNSNSGQGSSRTAMELATTPLWDAAGRRSTDPPAATTAAGAQGVASGSVDGTAQATLRTLHTGFALETSWYFLFCAAWIFLTSSVWARKLPDALLWPLMLCGWLHGAASMMAWKHMVGMLQEEDSEAGRDPVLQVTSRR